MSMNLGIIATLVYNTLSSMMSSRNLSILSSPFQLHAMGIEFCLPHSDDRWLLGVASSLKPQAQARHLR